MITNLTTDQTTTRANTSWRLGDRRNEIEESRLIAVGPAADPVGKVQSGTILGMITATKEVRPIRLAIASTTGDDTEHTVDDASHFRVGDTVSSYQSNNTTLIDADLVITAIDGNDITFDASTNLTADAIIRPDDGSGVVYGISWLDATTHKGSDESGEPVHGRGRVTVIRKGWVDWSKTINGKNTLTAAGLEALGFTVDNQ